MDVTKPRASQKMSEFGRALYGLMLSRGIEHRQDLVKLLNEGGYPISQARLSYYMNGERTVDPLFVACVSELLRLGKEERRRLAWTHTYGQLRLSQEDLHILAGFKDKL